MPEGWTRTTLGEAAVIAIGRTPPRKDKRYWTTDLERPFCTIADLERVTIPRREGVTARAEEEGKAKRVRKGSLLMSFKLTIGRIGFAGVDLFPNEAIAVLTPKSESLDPRFLAVALEAQNLAEHSARAVKGRTLNRAALKSIPLHVPPIQDQRRIVDLLSSIDHTISSLRWIHATCWQAKKSTMRRAFSDVDEGATPIRDLLEVSIGGVWGGDPGDSEVDVKVYRSTEFRGDGRLAGSGGVIRSVSQKQLQARQLRMGDILLEKSGGGPNQPVGRVVQVPELAEPAVCANFVQMLRPDPSKVLPEYLFGLLWWWHSSGRTEIFQRRTTGIRNLETQAYLDQVVQVPSVGQQRSTVALLSAVDRQLRVTEEELERLKGLRLAVLTDLLSGSHVIPDSYDRFLENVT